MRGRCRQPHHLAIGGLGNAAVLVFGVDGDAVGAVDQLAQHQQLAEEALAGAGRGHDGRVGVVQRPVERVEQHGRLAGAGRPTSMPLSIASDGPTNGSVAASALVSRLRGTSS